MHASCEARDGLDLGTAQLQAENKTCSGFHCVFCLVPLLSVRILINFYLPGYASHSVKETMAHAIHNV